MRVLLVGLALPTVEVVMLSMRLRWPDTQPVHANDPEQALVLANQEEFDVVLLSLDLREDAAFVFVRQLRHLNDVPLLGITSRDDEMVRVRAIELGCDEVVTSQCGLTELLSRITALPASSPTPLTRTSSNRPGPLWTEITPISPRPNALRLNGSACAVSLPGAAGP